MNRFIEKPDCFLDTETNLEWQKEQNPERLSWQEAIDYCGSLGEGWRLPTRKELFSLIDEGKNNPCTELPGMLLSGCWSSTVYVNNNNNAWLIHFNYGGVDDYDKYSTYYVRAVRSGQPRCNDDEVSRLKRRLEIINKLSAKE